MQAVFDGAHIAQYNLCPSTLWSSLTASFFAAHANMMPRMRDQSKKNRVDQSDSAISGGTLLALVLWCVCAVAQTAPSQRDFEVASIKASAQGGPSHPRLEQFMRDMAPGTVPMVDPGRVSIRRTSLLDLVAMAYGVRRTQVSGPAWMVDAIFDIDAKVPDGTPRGQVTPGPVTLGPVNEMLQSLLAERFGLALHHESKQVAGYALLVAKNGPKLTPSSSDGKSTADPGQTDLTMAQARAAMSKARSLSLGSGPGSGTGSETPLSVSHIELPRASMERLVKSLSLNLDGQTVVDMTGLNGTYDIVLDISRDSSGQAAPSVFEAVEKLGLKLGSRRIPTDILVIDKAAKTPTPN
jgi:uncharacterized protein (TIGR03435 family)